jgi:hypothetical protein
VISWRNTLRLLSLFIILSATAAFAQPYSAYLVRSSGHGYVEVPHSSDFNFTTGFTFEAWVSGSDTGACSGIAGKNYTQAWWIGVCGTTFRSYIKGTASLFDGGTVPANEFVHIAVTYDGAVRKHYVDGELVAQRVETGPMTNSTSPLRLNSDAAYAFSYATTLDEARIWNVARTQDQIREAINHTITSPEPGLVAVYHLDGSAVDSIAGHNGTTNGTAAYLTSPVALNCGSTTSSALCLTPNRFQVTSKWWIVGSGARGNGTVVPGSSSGSGLFWFFGSDNWELLVKVLDGCGLNSRKWVYAAGTTDQHFQLIVTDVKAGVTKRYFNYNGVASPAITDNEAFATCP